MKYVIGVDCGGTKTEASAYTITDGELLETTTTGFGNLVVDYSKAVANIRQAVDILLQTLGAGDCQMIVMGIAGIDSGGFKQKMAEEFSYLPVNPVFLNDAQLALYAILKGQDGVVVTAGTGSIMLGLVDNHWYRAGGWGHILGDEGSGFDIAKKAIQHVLHEYDSGEETSAFSKEILTFFDADDVFSLAKKVYQVDKGEIASAAQQIGTLATDYSQAQIILETAGETLAKKTLQLINKAPLAGKPISIGLNGSVIQKNERVLEAFTRYLDNCQLPYDLHKKEASSAKGAYYIYKGEQKL
ncbi:N-acetylglucosamine kinase [Vagococcus elongatus]|nr:BadF/BadG/BcrA/BcrD ATPase family protein [Vagococcus elongatus]